MKVFILMLALITVNAHALVYANYSVPVPPELEPYATYDLGVPEFRTVGNQIELTYHLPAELVGSPHLVVMRGKNRAGGVLLLKGKDAEASCFDRNDELECIVDYDNLKVDLNGVRNALTSRGVQGEELAKRLEVARLFGGEPVGIVKMLK